MTDAVNGEGLIGRLGLLSVLKDLIKATLSFGLAPAFAMCANARKGEGEPGERDRLMVAVAFEDLGGARFVLMVSFKRRSQTALAGSSARVARFLSQELSQDSLKADPTRPKRSRHLTAH